MRQVENLAVVQPDEEAFVESRRMGCDITGWSARKKRWAGDNLGHRQTAQHPSAAGNAAAEAFAPAYAAWHTLLGMLTARQRSPNAPSTRCTYADTSRHVLSAPANGHQTLRYWRKNGSCELKSGCSRMLRTAPMLGVSQAGTAPTGGGAVDMGRLTCWRRQAQQQAFIALKGLRGVRPLGC